MSLEIKSFDSPDENRPFADKGSAAAVSLAGGTALKGTFEPGWRWSEHVKPIAGTDSCQAAHLGYVLSGRMHVVMDDGTEGECRPRRRRLDPAGHDAWTVGDESCVLVDFGLVGDYAKRS